MAKTQAQPELLDDDPDDFASAETIEPVIDERIYRKMLTMKTIEAVPERAIVAKKRVLLCRISGIVSGTVQSEKADKTEQFTGLAGEFEAEVYDDDGQFRVYYGGICYLPAGFHEATLARLSRLRPEDATQNGGLAFSLEFAAEPAGNPAGYSYVARNVMRVSRRDDALARLADEARLVKAARPSLMIGAPAAA